MIPAHITAKGTFCEVPSLEEVIRLMRQVAEATSPFEVKFSPEGPRRGQFEEGPQYATQPIEKTSELVELHDRLYDLIAPTTTNAYAREDGDNYWPHMTIYSEPMPQLEHQADDLLESLVIGTGFDCDAMFLMGHIGPPYRGRWTVVREVPFGTSR